jgi:hypothetical protein
LETTPNPLYKSNPSKSLKNAMVAGVYVGGDEALDRDFEEYCQEKISPQFWADIHLNDMEEGNAESEDAKDEDAEQEDTEGEDSEWEDVEEEDVEEEDVEEEDVEEEDVEEEDVEEDGLEVENLEKLHISPAKGNWQRFHRTHFDAVQGRKFFISGDQGRFCVGPALLQPGDLCCLLLGCKMPIIIRPMPTRWHFKVLGPAFVEMAMQGETAEVCIKSSDDLLPIILV